MHLRPAFLFLTVLPSIMPWCAHASSWVVVDTGQDTCYGNQAAMTPPTSGQPFYGQDAQYSGLAPSYRDNGDGTVSDLNTGLMWSKAVAPTKVSLDEAEVIARGLRVGGHDDWRVPTIKELYSLIDFRGATGMGNPSSSTAPRSAAPYINTDFFDFRYGAADERFIDAQWLSRTRYVSTTMDGMPTLFGVNFADGRIKGYGYAAPHPGRPEKKFYARYVRGGSGYGENDFADNGDGTITDRATGLVWSRADSGRALTWEQALAYAENLRLAGHDDWRLPNAKELQAIVDYTRSPDTTDSPALSPLFRTTAITNEAGRRDWPFFWTSTTHLDGPDCRQAVYIAFGRALGQMHGEIMDVHGAGAQRSDPKIGQARIGRGPQGDAQRVLNFARCVRGGNVRPAPVKSPTDNSRYPLTVRVDGRSYRPEKITTPGPRPPAPDDAQTGFDGPTASTGDQSGGPGAAEFIRRLDRDGDGRVSKSEFDGPADGFTRLDRNRDGYIGPDEAPSGPPPGGGAPGPRSR